MCTRSTPKFYGYWARRRVLSNLGVEVSNCAQTFWEDGLVSRRFELSTFESDYRRRKRYLPSQRIRKLGHNLMRQHFHQPRWLESWIQWRPQNYWSCRAKLPLVNRLQLQCWLGKVLQAKFHSCFTWDINLQLIRFQSAPFFAIWVSFLEHLPMAMDFIAIWCIGIPGDANDSRVWASWGAVGFSKGEIL